jgi:hypothetical protein
VEWSGPLRDVPVDPSPVFGAPTSSVSSTSRVFSTVRAAGRSKSRLFDRRDYVTGDPGD